MRTTIPVTKSHPAVKAILAATFPEWRGRKVRIVATDGPFHFSPAWDGGSRDVVHVVRLADGAVGAYPCDAPWSDTAQAARDGVKVPPGLAIVMHSTFCGKDAGVSIYVAPPTLRAFPAGTLAALPGGA